MHQSLLAQVIERSTLASQARGFESQSTVYVFLLYTLIALD